MAQTRKWSWGVQERAAAWANLLALFVLAAGVCVLANLNGERHFVRKDMTESQIYAITDQTRNLIQHRVKQDVYIYIVGQSFSTNKSIFQAMEMLRNLLTEFRRLNPKRIHVEAITGRTPKEKLRQLQTIFGGPLKDAHVYVLTYKAVSREAEKEAEVDPNYKEIPIDGFFRGDQRTGKVIAFQGEAAIANAIQDLTNEKPRRIYVTAGHGEIPRKAGKRRDPRNYQMMAQRMERQLNVEFEDLRYGFSAVPTDAEALFVPDPRGMFLPTELKAIRDYLEGGGYMFLCLKNDTTNFAEFMKEFDIEVLGNWLMAPKLPDRSFIPLRLMPDPTTGLRTALNEPIAPWYDISELRATTERKRPDFNLRTVAQTLYPTVPVDRVLAEQSRDPNRLPLPAGKPVRRTVVLAGEGPLVAGSVERARIVVWGSDWGPWNPRLNSNHWALFHNTLSWLLKEQDRIDAPIKASKHEPLFLEKEQVDRIFLLSVVGMPFLSILAGFVVWLLRRR